MNWKVRSRRAERTRWAVRVCETSRQEVEATVESGIVEKRWGGAQDGAESRYVQCSGRGYASNDLS
jgi:hypothetical protein